MKPSRASPTATPIIFLSAGYFKSWNCRRELHAALASKRPFIVVHEADSAKGGASIQALRDASAVRAASRSPHLPTPPTAPDEVLARVFDEADPIVWVRVHDFQVESLKEIALRMLRHTPYYLHTNELTPGVAVPGEIRPHGFTGVVTILVCHGNKGAHDLAKELKAAEAEGRSSSAATPKGNDAPERVTIREAEEALEANAPPLHGNVVFLLYLTERTFFDEGGAVARLVQKAMDRGISITPVAEQEPCRGGCAFRQFFQQTPQVLQQPPYKLFDTLAVPLYPSVQHRKVSLRHVLRGMGAQPQGGTHGGVLATAAKVICCHPSGCLRRNGGTMDVSVRCQQ